MSDPDLGLLERWRNGDRAAGNDLFRGHFTALYQFFEHKTPGAADDLVQETFLQCVKSQATFRHQSSFRTYLFAIARHVLLGHWRSRAPTPTVDFEEISIASLSTSLGTRLAAAQERARMIDALRTLPLEQQLLLELHLWHDFGREQLAEIFEVEPATIGSRLHRARKALEDRLTEDAPSATS